MQPTGRVGGVPLEVDHEPIDTAGNLEEAQRAIADLESLVSGGSLARYCSRGDPLIPGDDRRKPGGVAHSSGGALRPPE
jgi:hypothetical protein